MTEEQARREITDRLEPQGGRVLEVSIGPGVNLPYLVGRPDVGEIYGLDISLGQLNRCREYVAHQGWDIQLQLGNAEQLPYQDNTFDGVFHVGGINFFNDKKKAIEEMIRVAKPGTRILICDENEKGAQAYERFLPGFKRHVGEQSGMRSWPPLSWCRLRCKKCVFSTCGKAGCTVSSSASRKVREAMKADAFRDQVVIVTGASSGIGRALALQLAGAGGEGGAGRPAC